MSLRTLFIALVLVNLIFFVWAGGYLGGTEEGHEPQRVAGQLEPDKLKVLGVEAPLAKLPAEACRALEGLTPELAQRLRKLAEEQLPELKLANETTEETSRYWVLVPPMPDRVAVEKKVAELKRLGISGYQVVEEEGALKLAVVLGTFTSEQAANDFLAALAKRGVRSARLQPREKSVVKLRLLARGAADSLEEKLRGLLQGFPAVQPSPCPEQP